MEHQFKVAHSLIWIDDKPTIGKSGRLLVQIILLGNWSNFNFLPPGSEWLRLEIKAEGSKIEPRKQFISLKADSGKEVIFQVIPQDPGKNILLLSVIHNNVRILTSEISFETETIPT